MVNASETFRYAHDTKEYDNSLKTYRQCREELKRVLDLIPNLPLSAKASSEFTNLYTHYYYQSLNDEIEVL